MGAARGVEMVVAGIILASSLCLQTMAQTDCQGALASLASPCLEFVTKNNNSAPSMQCCSQLDKVVQTQPQCLCEVLNQNSLNETRVLELPKACRVKTPPVSKCNSPPGSPASQAANPPTAGYSTRISYSPVLGVLVAAISAGIFVTCV